MIKYGFLFLLAISVSQSSFADWRLDSKASSVGFVSVKNTSVVESHHFKEVTGSISKSGNVAVQVDLASVETMIPIRNERMQAMLFETVKFPQATLTTNVDMKRLKKLKTGHSQSMKVSGSLDLHGHSVDLETMVTVTRISRGGFQVTSQQPVILQTDQWNLGTGIEALRNIAGLKSITPAVPVSFNLVFKKD